jgi:hypothetical protein
MVIFFIDNSLKRNEETYKTRDAIVWESSFIFPYPITGVLSPLATEIWYGGDKILKSSTRF